MSEKEKQENLDLFLGGQYVAPQSKESIVDAETGKVEDIRDLPPLQQMQLAAKKFNIPINEKPKKNCKKCLERGYLGFNKDDKSPVPCPCMFPPKQVDKKDEGKVPLSFLPRKVQRKFFRDKKKQLRKEIRKESTLRELRRAKDEFLKSLETSGTDVVSGGELPIEMSALQTEPTIESEGNNVREVTQG
jgi:hypothetical protein